MFSHEKFHGQFPNLERNKCCRYRSNYRLQSLERKKKITTRLLEVKILEIWTRRVESMEIRLGAASGNKLNAIDTVKAKREIQLVCKR